MIEMLTSQRRRSIPEIVRVLSMVAVGISLVVLPLLYWSPIIPGSQNTIAFTSISIMLVAFAVINYFKSRPRDGATTWRRHSQADDSRTDNLNDALLRKAELLLSYAAEKGIEVGEPQLRAIYNFRRRPKEDINPDLDDALVIAGFNLEREVTALLQMNRLAQKYRDIITILSAFLIPLTLLSFISYALSLKIGQEIDIGNSLILQLRDELGPNFAENPRKLNDYDIIMKVQQLSTTMRSLHEAGNQIAYTLFGLMPRTLPPSYERISAGLPNIGETIADMIPEYQSLRQRGQTGRDLGTIIYGTVLTFILPVLYAVLGACAKRLGQCERRIRRRAYSEFDANSAQFVVAAIAGGFVGGFYNFTLGRSPSIFPFLIAFLVGLCMDIFVSLLETASQFLSERTAPDRQAEPVPESTKPPSS